MKKLLLFLFALALGSTLFVQHIHAQVSVTATAGTPGPTPYTTVKLAFDAINAGTHQGAVTISITASTTEGTTPATLNSSGAGSALYTAVLLQPTTDGVSISGNPTTGFGVIQLNGADNVTIDGDNPNTSGTNRNLTINNTAVTTVIANSCIRLATSTAVTSCNSNIIQNCILNGNVTGGNISTTTSTTGSSNSSFGIYCGGNGGATVTGAPTAITSVTTNTAPATTTINNLLISNNAISQCARAIVFNGASAAVCPGTLSITNNVIGAAGTQTGNPPYTTPSTTVYTKGIYMAGLTAAIITGNTLQNVMSYIGTTITGIEFASAIGTGLLTITGNSLTTIVNNAASSCLAITVASSTGTYNISGNTVSGIWAALSSCSGINCATSATSGVIAQNIVTTVRSRTAGGNFARGIVVSSGSAVSIQNNFISDVLNIGSASFSNSYNTCGILLSGGTNHKVYFNSVNLFGVSASIGSNSINCLSISANTQTGIDVRNNIFSNTVTGGAATDAHTCIFMPFAASATMLLTLNNNTYYTGSITGKSGVAFAGTSTYGAAYVYDAANFNPALNTPATNFRSFSSALGVATNDNASFASTAAAPFLTSTNLHLDPASGQLVNVEQKGALGTGVLTDIDGNPRPNAPTTLPDIGADEVIVVVCEAANGGTITPSTQNKCIGQTATMSAIGAEVGAGISYQWEISATGGGSGFSNVTGGSGATSNAYTTEALTTGTYYYRLKVTCTPASVSGYSNELTVIVNTLPTVTVSPISAMYCSPTGTAVELTADGASTYAWSPALGLDAITGAVVHASPASTTPFIVTGTDVNGCTNTATSTITVAAAVTMNSVSALPPSVCFGESTVLTASASIASGTYCTPVYTSYDGTDGISNVSLKNSAGTVTLFTRTSGATGLPGYDNQTALTTTTLTAGTTYQISLSILTSADNVAAFMDFNNNGVFTDAGETIMASTAVASNGTNTISFTVPAGAYNGSARLRCVERYSTAAIPCVTAGYGETEDYVVAIIGGVDLLTYLWSENPSSGTLSSTTLNPTSGVGITVTETYSVTATALSGCAATGSVIVSAGALLTAAATADPATPVCIGTLVTLTGTPTGGGGPYTYSWKVDGREVSTEQIYEVTPAETTTYDLTITDNCTQVADALPLTITVNPLPTAEVSPAGTVNICVPNTQLLSGTTSASSPAYQWQLNGSDIDGATDADYTVSVTGIYSLIVTDGVTECVKTSSEVTVNINPLPTAFTITPDAPVVQVGGVQQLTASNSVTMSTLLNEDFNGSVPGWTTVNASTGGTPAAAAWMLYTSSPTFYSNDNTNFILSNSDGQGSGGTTRTQLISPVINTTGYSGLALNFWHIFKIYNATDNGKIEVSIDGGLNWISPALKTYTTDQGTGTAWVQATVDLSAYINQTNLKIRFNYYATWGYYWGIDNLSITGSVPATITWSPNTYLYTDADTTTRYTGGDPAQTVYTRPRGNTTYTATATSAAGCTTTQNVNVTSCPEAPGALAPSNITTTSFDLNWEYTLSGQQPAGYNILVATDSEFRDIFGDFTVANSVFTQSVTAPEGNTEYFYQIIANGAAGCDGLSITGSVITCPDVPVDPVSSDNKTDGFTISWTAPPGGKASAITYSIDVATDDAFTAPVNYTVADPDVTVVITGLAGNTEYFYRIQATNGCGSAYTSTASEITCAAVPGVPVVSYLAPDGFTLTWTAPDGGTASAITYSVEVADNPLFTGAVVTPVAASVLTLTVTGLTSSTLYYYRIKAIGVCAGDFTTPGSVTTLCTPAVAPFIEDFELAEFAPNCWTNSAVAGSFVWERTTKVSGNGGGGGSALANFFNQTDGTYELTTMPFDITGLTDPTLKFNYAYATYVVEIDEMNVYYSTNYGETWIPMLLMPGGLTGILNTAGSTFDEFIPTASQWCTQSLPLEPGTNMVKFVATSAYGNNLYLDNICVADPVGMDLTLADLTITGNVAYQVANNIDVAGGSTYYIVENSGSATIIAGNRINIGPGTRVDAGGYLHGYISFDMDCSLVKAPTIPTIISGNGENSFDIGKTAITLYPNPTSGNFTLVQKGDKLFGNVNVEVYNIQGEKVMTDQMVGEKKHQFNFADMPVGLYFVKVVAEDYVETIKLVKTR